MVTIKDIKKGDKFKIVGDRLVKQGYYEFQPGTIVQVTYKNASIVNIIQVSGNSEYTGRQACAIATDLNPLATNKEDLEKELAILDKQKEEIQNKINWIIETGSKEYDETEVKVWTTLKTLENKKLTPLEKSKVIAKLIKES